MGQNFVHLLSPKLKTAEKINNELQLFGEKLLFQAIKMAYPKTKLPPITCRGDQKWTKI